MSRRVSAVVGETLVYADGSSSLLLDSDASNNGRYLKGYNTYTPQSGGSTSSSSSSSTAIVSSITGLVEVTDRVVSVRGAAPRYLPEIGDVVIGRVVDLSGTRWRVNVNGLQDAVLLLANVTEPGGVLRRRGREDELAMRSIFQESDLLVAEVQRISPDGLIFLHTRTAAKYGRRNQHGILVTIRPSLVRRTRRQFHTFVAFGVHMIVGVNGGVWIEVASEEQLEEARKPLAKGVADGPVSDDDDDDEDSSLLSSAAEAGSTQDAVSLVDLADPAELLRTVALFANCVKVLAAAKIVVFPRTVLAAVMASRTLGVRPFEVLLAEFSGRVVQAAREVIAQRNRNKRARVE